MADTKTRKDNVYAKDISTGLQQEILNKETIQAIEDCENGVGLSKDFSSVEELMEDLDN